MSDNSVSNNKRIAKNTILLYARTLFVMIISLYTSRVILQVLGVEDYGVYQVVGGMVAMFAVISQSLSSAISRYITYEIGSGNKERLAAVFSTSKVVQLVMAGIVLVLGEIIGLWFMHTHMQIPDGRMDAANWVLQFSLISFCVNLLNIPYSACIIAHEHMKAFAYISIFDSLSKLVICYLLLAAPIDKLVYYSLLLMVLSFGNRTIYALYCRKQFEEYHSPFHFYKNIFKEMFGFAGWSFYTNTNYLLNTQGVNMLINVFFGVTFNAARGLANQVESAVVQFVNSFTTAINPQITKSYAAGDKEAMCQLICRGAKFSFFLMYMMALPLMFEAEMVLNIWLTVIPEKTVIFVQLSLILGMFDCFGSSAVTACMATGKIRLYSFVIGTLGLLEFPIVWIAFAAGAEIEMAYYLYIVIKAIVIIARMFLMERMVGMPVSEYIRKAIMPSLIVAVLAATPSLLIVLFMPQTFIRLLVSVVIGVISVGLSALYVGMSAGERMVVVSKAKEFVSNKLFKK
jgi:O-antigen/teichoic acid export membrane protein